MIDWIRKTTITITQRNNMAALEDKAIWEDGEVGVNLIFSVRCEECYFLGMNLCSLVVLSFLLPPGNGRGGASNADR